MGPVHLNPTLCLTMSDTTLGCAPAPLGHSMGIRPVPRVLNARGLGSSVDLWDLPPRSIECYSSTARPLAYSG